MTKKVEKVQARVEPKTKNEILKLAEIESRSESAMLRVLIERGLEVTRKMHLYLQGQKWENVSPMFSLPQNDGGDPCPPNGPTPELN